VQHDFEVFRRAWIVIGPHGGQLWNFAFAKPGTQMVEFTTWEDTFVAEDCRTCGFSLANAAGHEYAIVDTPDWENYGASDLKPAAEDLLELVDGFLGRNAAAIRASPNGVGGAE
jgi:capsular polysaccharide biosynthesis protein